MKLPLLVLFLLVPTLFLRGEEKPSLRLLTYNIHAGIGVDQKFDLERIAAVIKEVEPQVVALQEVDKETKRSRGIDIAKELSRLTGMKHVFGPAISIGGGEYGNALLTTLPIEGSDTIAIPREVDTEHRSLLSVDLRFHGETIQILATHLCHQQQVNREAAAAFIATQIAPKERGSFLMGDLNALPDSEPLRRLMEAGWILPPGKPAFTVPVDEPTRQIDYVLYRGAVGQAVTVKEVRVLEERVASDHRALLAVFEW